MTEALHPIFSAWPMPQLRPDTFDQALEAHPGEWIVVFFWGHDCPNCEVAKRMLFEEMSEYKKFALHWYHVNTYENMELGTRFGLHGIPTFLFFKDGRTKSRATSFPGHEEFLKILEKVTAG